MNKEKLITRSFVAGMFTMLIYSMVTSTLPVCLENIRGDLNLTLAQGGSFGFISSMVQFFIMISSCYMSAHFAKIKIMKTALLIVAVGVICFSLITNFFFGIIIFILIGIGNGMLEAMLTPYVVDLYPNDKGSKQNLLHSAWPIGSILSFLVIGFLLSQGVSWRYIFPAFVVPIFIIIAIYPKSKHVELPLSSASSKDIKDILKTPRFWLFGFAIFFAGAIELSFAFWMPSYIQQILKVGPLFGGIAAALFALGMAIGRIGTSRLAKIINIFHIMMSFSAMSLIVSVLFLLNQNTVYIYVMIFLMGLFISCQWPSLQTYAVNILKKDSTLVMVFLSCFGIPGTSVATLMIGILGDNFGIKNAFFIVPLYGVIFIILLLVIKFSSKKNETEKNA